MVPRRWTILVSHRLLAPQWGWNVPTTSRSIVITFLADIHGLIRMWWHRAPDVSSIEAPSSVQYFNFNTTWKIYNRSHQSLVYFRGHPDGRKQSFFPLSSSASFQEYLRPDGSTENDRKRCSSYSRPIGGVAFFGFLHPETCFQKSAFSGSVLTIGQNYAIHALHFRKRALSSGVILCLMPISMSPCLSKIFNFN